jgi:hypothetical protein
VTDSTADYSVFWAPELGYSYLDTTRGPTHLFSASIGPGFLAGDTGVALFARFVLGTQSNHLAIGGRATLQWLLLYGVVGLEVGYQFLHTDAGDTHDVLALAFIDPGVLLGIASRVSH